MKRFNNFHLSRDFDREAIIIVEGKDDIFLIGKLLERMGASPERFGIAEIDGYPNFQPFLKMLTLGSSFTTGRVKSVAVILDADENFGGRRKEVCEVFRQFGWDLSEDSRATINRSATDQVNIYLFLYPDNRSSGDLESLLLGTLESDPVKDSAQQHIGGSFAVAQTRGESLKGSITKRVAQAYLAGRAKDLCNGAGMAAARAVAFDLDSAALQPLCRFLRDMHDELAVT
ncbi:DUF3226 domain-containing protein [Ideonella alba]|uniref:Uncharacterized protein n=1 Tax=Ideonella alba TaxID=2824118 RepID=A0A940Y5R0_9BURK|nr:DUF3226 domain-containing protein [Ideonella alba]MBQ0929233.1 hypothetical protein [Ideonella alba]